MWNMRDLIKKILRGWRPGDDNDSDSDDDSILLESDKRILAKVEERSITPEMLVYGSNMKEKSSDTLTGTIVQPVASSSTAPPAPTNQGEPLTLLEQIKLGKNLKKVKTIEKSAKLLAPTSSTLLESLPWEKKDLENPSSSLTSALSKGFEKIKNKMITQNSIITQVLTFKIKNKSLKFNDYGLFLP